MVGQVRSTVINCKEGQTYKVSFKIKSKQRLDVTPYIWQNEYIRPNDVSKTALIWYNEVSDSTEYNFSFESVAEKFRIDLNSQVDDYVIREFRTLPETSPINPVFITVYTGQQSLENTWKELIVKEINFDNNNGFKYPLIDNTYEKEEVVSIIEVLIGNRLTMGKNVELFEQEFARYVGAKYAIMVNSGSSANLLAMAVASNYMRKQRLCPGDKVIVPTVCWSTSVWPIIQMNLEPVFVDVDPTTMNMDIDDLKSKLTPDVKGIVAVHILGNCTNMDELMEIVSDRNLFLMEDTCESLGSTYKNKYLGTFGDFGTYSFYYSHHITTIEGGMVVCNDDEDFELLKCLRAHGWTRYLKNKKEYEQRYTEVDPRFLFVNLGYNFRPMEMQAAMGRIQLSKLVNKNDNRIWNHDTIVQKVIDDPRNTGILTSPVAMQNANPAWFALCFVLSEKNSGHYTSYLNYLTKCGVENRPIVTGNFARQPAMNLLGLNIDPNAYPGADVLHFRGFFIGLPCRQMSNQEINELVDILLNYDFK